MKAYFWIPIACLIGILVGSWGPRGEIREMKRIAEEERDKGKKTSVNGFKTFADFVKIPDEARRPHRRRNEAKPLFAGATNRMNVVSAETNATETATAGGQTDIVAGNASTNGNRKADSAGKPLSSGDLRARLEEAQDLWRTRVEIARTNWKIKLKIAPGDEERFLAAFDEMNEQMYESMRNLAQLVAEKNRMTAELGLRLVADMTTIMAETYDKIGACAPAETREQVSNLPMTDFMDPGVADPLIEVQDVLEKFPGRF